MEFYINWKYPSLDGKKGTFAQSYELNLMESKYNSPSFCAGVLISNLINACELENRSEDYKNSEAYKYWNMLCQKCSDIHTQDLSLPDAMAFPAFCIDKNVRTMLKEIGNYFVNKNSNGFSQVTIDILGERRISELRTYKNVNDVQIEQSIQTSIDTYCDSYNKLLNTRKSDENFYEDLRRCMEKYNNDKHPLIKQYLAPKNKESRCFATFVESASQKKYVSFSGTVDAKNRKILNWLNSPMNGFVKVAKKICQSNDAQFIPINLHTRLYIVKDYSAPIVGQGLSLEDQINNHANNDIKKDYSCCERKIFGHFGDKTPNGTLYVKMAICAKCALGLIYQLQNGSQIKLCDDLW